MKLATFFIAVLAVLPSHAQVSNVLTVGPGQMFADIQTAAGAAQPGDVLLLRSYSLAADFAGQGLTVVEDELFSVSLTPLAPSLPIEVRAVPAGRALTISGVETVYPVVVSNCAGAVRFQNCQFLAGLSIANCADVRLSNCQVRGRPTTSGLPSGSLAMSIVGSGVVLDHTIVRGSSGANAGFASSQFVPAGHGGDGLHVTNSTVLASGCSIQSGAGGTGHSAPCASANPPTSGGDAGDALVVMDASSHVSLLETQTLALAPGAGGFSNPFPACLQPNGATGADVTAPAGTIGYPAGSARWLTSFAQAREGQVFHCDVAGLTGDTVVLALSESPANGVTILPQGSIAIELPPRRIVLGTIGPFGVMPVDLNVPELGAGVLGRVYHAQIVCIDTAGQAWFGTPMTLTLLDSSL